MLVEETKKNLQFYTLPKKNRQDGMLIPPDFPFSLFFKDKNIYFTTTRVTRFTMDYGQFHPVPCYISNKLSSTKFH